MKKEECDQPGERDCSRMSADMAEGVIKGMMVVRGRVRCVGRWLPQLGPDKGREERGQGGRREGLECHVTFFSSFCTLDQAFLPFPSVSPSCLLPFFPPFLPHPSLCPLHPTIQP